MGSFLRDRVRSLTQPRDGEPRRLPLGIARGIRLAGDTSLSLDTWFGFFESELAPFVRASCVQGAACADVGSYNGYYALLFAKLGATRVRAYDPNPAAVERIRRNLALNPKLAGAIESREASVGAEGVTLDGDLADWERVDLLKIDVEGAELDVLRGAARLLADSRPRVIVETHSAELERGCADLLRGHGYEPRVVEQRRLLPQNRPGEHNRWLVASA
jgi:hypothetical protein